MALYRHFADVGKLPLQGRQLVDPIQPEKAPFGLVHLDGQQENRRSSLVSSEVQTRIVPVPIHSSKNAVRRIRQDTESGSPFLSTTFSFVSTNPCFIRTPKHISV